MTVIFPVVTFRSATGMWQFGPGEGGCNGSRVTPISRHLGLNGLSWLVSTLKIDSEHGSVDVCVARCQAGAAIHQDDSSTTVWVLCKSSLLSV